jgi:hypothetical protein
MGYRVDCLAFGVDVIENDISVEHSSRFKRMCWRSLELNTRLSDAITPYLP